MEEIIRLIDAGIKSKNGGEFLDSIREIRKIPNSFIARMVELKMENHITTILGRAKNQIYQGTPYKAGVCQKCGEVIFNTEIVRNGHRKINIELEYGREEISIPRIIHNDKACKGCIETIFGIFNNEKRKRGLIEVSRNFLADYIEGASHRGAGRIEGHRNNTNYSAMKSWNNLKDISNKLPELKTPLPEELILFGDELSIRLREIRKNKKSEKQEIFGLELIGIDPQKNKTQLIALDITKERTEASWVKVFKQLKLRGLKKISLLVRDGSIAIENAARSVLDVSSVQECHFHRMKSLFDKLKKRLNDNDLAEDKYVKTCKQIYKLFRAKTKNQAEKELNKITDVITYKKLNERFDALFGNLGKENIHYTNNLIERSIKDYKRRIKPMECFKKFEGAKMFSKIFLYKEYYRKENKDWIKEVFGQISLDIVDKLQKLNIVLGERFTEVPEKYDWTVFEKKQTSEFKAMQTATNTGEFFRRITTQKDLIDLPYRYQAI